MVSQPVDILLLEDNDDDIVMIQEAYTTTKMMNVMHVIRDGEAALRVTHMAVGTTTGGVSSRLGIQEFLGSVNVAFRGWSSGEALHTGEVAVDPHSAGG